MDYELSLKFYGHHPTTTTTQLLSMKEVLNDKTQSVIVTQYDPNYQLSTKKVYSKRDNMDESNMMKENIIK